MSFLQYLDKELPDLSRWILYDGLKYSTEVQIYDAILQLEEELLRPMHANGKKDTPAFKLFLRIKDMLYQAGEANAIIQRQKEEIYALRNHITWLNQELSRTQIMLDRFQTVEDMAGAGTLEITIDRVRQVMQQRREQEQKKAEAILNADKSK